MEEEEGNRGTNDGSGSSQQRAARRAATPMRTPSSAGSVQSVRDHPYPQRRRTPLYTPPQPPVRSSRQRALTLASQSPPQVPVPPSPHGESAAPPAPTDGRDEVFSLRVRPIVKATVNQQDASGDELEELTATGSSFQAVLQVLWRAFSSHVRAVAARANDEWIRRDTRIEDWSSVMALKSKTHRVPSNRDERNWNAWLVRVRNDTEPVTLLIYRYGQAISTNKKLKEYEAKFFPPHACDRAGAPAEAVIADVIKQLRDRWGTTLRGSHVAWRLWAADITSSNDNSVWASLIDNPPASHLVGYFSATDSRVLQQNGAIRRSARVALEVVDASISDYRVLRSDVDGIQRRLEDIERSLRSRKRVLEGLIDDLAPPSPSQVPDPLEDIENIEDFEHQ